MLFKFCEELNGNQPDQTYDQAAGDEYPIGTAREPVEQSPVDDLSYRLCTQGEGKYIGHYFTHQVLGCVLLYNRNGIGGKQTASKLASEEHRQ